MPSSGRGTSRTKFGVSARSSYAIAIAKTHNSPAPPVFNLRLGLLTLILDKDAYIEVQNQERGTSYSLGRTELGRLVTASNGKINGTTW